jgi:hypothetical protein
VGVLLGATGVSDRDIGVLVGRGVCVFSGPGVIVGCACSVGLAGGVAGLMVGIAVLAGG